MQRHPIHTGRCLSIDHPLCMTMQVMFGRPPSALRTVTMPGRPRSVDRIDRWHQLDAAGEVHDAERHLRPAPLLPAEHAVPADLARGDLRVLPTGRDPGRQAATHRRSSLSVTTVADCGGLWRTVVGPYRVPQSPATVAGSHGSAPAEGSWATVNSRAERGPAASISSP